MDGETNGGQEATFGIIRGRFPPGFPPGSAFRNRLRDAFPRRFRMVLYSLFLTWRFAFSVPRKQGVITK